MKFLFLIPFLFGGCASIPATITQSEITGVLDSGILDPAHVITPEEKTKLRLALMHSRESIGDAEEKLEKAKSSETWATRGKIGAVILAVLIILSVVGLIRKFSFF